MTTTEIILVIITAFTTILALTFFVAYRLKKRALENATIEEESFQHNRWELLEDEITYVIPFSTKLYRFNGVNFEEIGSVAKNFKYFSKRSIGSILDEVCFNGASDKTYVYVKFIHADSRSDFAIIESESGVEFGINISECKGLPSSLKIAVPKAAENNKKN